MSLIISLYYFGKVIQVTGSQLYKMHLLSTALASPRLNQSAFVFESVVIIPEMGVQIDGEAHLRLAFLNQFLLVAFLFRLLRLTTLSRTHKQIFFLCVLLL